MLDWEHEKYGIILNTTAGDLVRMFPDQNLKDTCLRKVARNPKRSYKGWFIKGHMRPKSPEPRANWHHKEKGIFFGKTSKEIKEINGETGIYLTPFNDLISGKRKTSRGWIILKKTPKAYNKVESRVVKPKENL